MRTTWPLLGVVTIFSVLFFLPANVPAEGGSAEASPPALEVFTAQKCNLCHSIESLGVERRSKSEKMKGPDLSDVGSRHDAEWMEAWLRQEENLEGEIHEREFKGSDEELETIVEWLATLEGEEASG